MPVKHRLGSPLLSLLSLLSLVLACRLGYDHTATIHKVVGVVAGVEVCLVVPCRQRTSRQPAVALKEAAQGVLPGVPGQVLGPGGHSVELGLVPLGVGGRRAGMLRVVVVRAAKVDVS